MKTEIDTLALNKRHILACQALHACDIFVQIPGFLYFITRIDSFEGKSRTHETSRIMFSFPMDCLQ